MESKTAAASTKVGESESARDENEKRRNYEQQQAQTPTVNETSPYVRYADLEDYKIKAYGSPGHLPVVDRPHHGGGTDAPTLSSSGLPQHQAKPLNE